MPNEFTGDLFVGGNLEVAGTLPTYPRDSLEEEQAAVYGIDLDRFRKATDFAVLLPATPLTPDLGIVTGSYGTDWPRLETEDHKANGAATPNRVAFIFSLPPEYVNGTDLSVRIRAGMKANAADVAATVDVEVYSFDDPTTDLVSTAVQSINSTTLASKTFSVDTTSILKNDKLLVIVTTSVEDTASGSAVEAVIDYIEMLCDIAG